MNIYLYISFILLSYFSGAVPYGYILTKRFTGKNILEAGSGNVGSTNVGRVAGKKLSLVTQILDMLKGLLPVALFLIFIDETDEAAAYLIYFIAGAAILGHNFSVFLKFRGGKGVNTSLGASLLIAPYSVFISVILYFIVKWKFKYVSLGSIVLGISLPVSEFLIHSLTPTFYYLCFCSVLILIRHHKNIRRLLQNKELPS